MRSADDSIVSDGIRSDTYWQVGSVESARADPTETARGYRRRRSASSERTAASRVWTR